MRVGVGEGVGEGECEGDDWAEADLRLSGKGVRNLSGNCNPAREALPRFA